MASGTQIQGWNGVSRRRVPRFRTQAPVDVTVLRAGAPDTVPGRSVNVCERGIAVVLAGELLPGETVSLDVRLSPSAEPLHAKATVRYHDKLRCGFEFLAMSPEQRVAIREWAREARAETEISKFPAASANTINALAAARSEKAVSGWSGSSNGSRKSLGRTGWLAVLLALVIGASVFWWRWDRGWKELEAGLKDFNSSAEPAPIHVPTEKMQKLLVHKVDPVYPEEARKHEMQGIIALDIVVSREGSVVNMRPLNGPDVLARAAMDALRWWKFSPYLVNGAPVTVETTMAVEFKR
jgi:TonB family protein